MKKVLVGLVILLLGFVLVIRFVVLPSLGDPKMIVQALFGTGIDSPDDATVRNRFSLPKGLGIRLFLANLPNVRQLAVTPEGDVLAVTPRSGTVYRIVRQPDGRAAEPQVLLTGLNKPHGMLFREGYFYVAETDAVRRYRWETGEPTAGEVILSGLPGGGNHWVRNLMDGGDGWIYINIGSSCNVCIEEDERRGSILRFRPDGSGEEMYAGGLRNSTAMAKAPWDGAFYALDISRDLLGDGYPVDEMNRIRQGAFYGWPYANEDKDPDPDFGEQAPDKVAASLPPVLGFPAHTSPLDLHFLRHAQWQKRFGRAALVTLHGSWNRSTPDGYRLELLRFDADGPIRRESFLDGFLSDGEVTGRPVDLVELADGTLLLSDDYAGAIYAIAPGESGDFAASGAAASAESFEPAQVAAGERVYQRYACDSCHGPDAVAGGGKPIPLKTLGARYNQAALAEFFIAPNPPMPVFPLTPAEREALAAYLLQRD